MIDTLEMTLNVFNNPYIVTDPLEEQRRFERLWNYINDNKEDDPSFRHKTSDGRKLGYPYSFNRYKDNGIQLQAIDGRQKFIKATIHPHQVLDPSDKVTLYTPSEKESFLSGINHIMDAINAPHIDCSHWQVNRIDYAVNIPTVYTRLYLDLLNRSRSKYHLERKEYDGNSCYLKGKGCTYNVYSKENQLQKKLNNPKSQKEISEDDIINASDVLRIEIQCHYGKVKAIQKKHGWKDRNLINYLQSTIAVEQLHELTKHYILGDYFNCTKGKPLNIYDRITKAPHIRQTTKDQLITIVSLMAKDRKLTLDKVGNAAGFTKSQFNALLRKFSELNINPVTIPTRQCKEYHLRHLDSLQYVLDDYLEITGLI